ncbi:MAG: putative Mg2+ transporter-C (MgtC) family protein [Candidatus Diapherotrites archaeon]|nr:putative Mg2+ transporter-C (MgtC) family protein [Candidatus Diapherotrites archaeon]MDN5367209.1 putative Mg2+ transporter-C (MgtC) family protein [Candidatus Diapherotrites archaeon]
MVITMMEAIFRIVFAAFLSFFLGLDRERRGKPAGLRTMLLVGTGAALFTVVSIYGFPGSDPSRVASNIVTGVGFLGAGTILRVKEKERILGLTTAATIWYVAAVGTLVGVGMYAEAVVATILGWLILESKQWGLPF